MEREEFDRFLRNLTKSKAYASQYFYERGKHLNIFPQVLNPIIMKRFGDEVVSNILTRKTIQEKIDLMIFYIHEVEKILFFGEDFYNDHENYTEIPDWAIPKFQTFPPVKTLIEMNSLFSHFCYIIEDYCSTYDIPIERICKQKFMNLSHFTMNNPAYKNSNKNLSLFSKDKISPLPFEINTDIEDLLRLSLKNLGFYSLDKVKNLSAEGRDELLSFIHSNGVPYKLAMFEFLGFNKFLEKKSYFKRNDFYIALATLLNTTKRTIQGNLISIVKKPDSKQGRYTAHNYIDTVKNDYHKLK